MQTRIESTSCVDQNFSGIELTLLGKYLYFTRIGITPDLAMTNHRSGKDRLIGQIHTRLQHFMYTCLSNGTSLTVAPITISSYKDGRLIHTLSVDKLLTRNDFTTLRVHLVSSLFHRCS